ncbi:MAG TPA: hypothetical protein DCE41_37835 [Cytophagales bacterium]|nr:hypothetical protein [Cytophagales bacterium]HAA21784.1 hypothetical protein [Cytophagales bacterium]HAP58799.1 hypothetical protein [Cytophagales bacterium]
MNEKFENRLRKANVNYESIKRQRASVYSSSLVIIAIGVVVIITGYLYGKLTLEGGVISTVPLIVMAVGLTPIGLGFRKLVHYKQEFDDARRKKDKVDNVVKANNLLYDIDISFGKVIHGAQEVHAELKISGRR